MLYILPIYKYILKNWYLKLILPFFKFIIHNVSKESTMVNPRLNQSWYFLVIGLTWSCPQAYLQYPSHACLNAFNTAICRWPVAGTKWTPSPNGGFIASLKVGAAICSFWSRSSLSSISFNFTASTPIGKFKF